MSDTDPKPYAAALLKGVMAHANELEKERDAARKDVEFWKREYAHVLREHDAWASVAAGLKATLASPAPIDVLLNCPVCGERHIDEGEFETKVHHTHACQTCGTVWRPAIGPTRGVRFLPGFKS